jgi:hypothetical protein
MGPRLWRRFIKPRVAQLYARAKGAGKYVMQHSCGAIQELFPDLIEIGLDIFNTFQPEVMACRHQARVRRRPDLIRRYQHPAGDAAGGPANSSASSAR